MDLCLFKGKVFFIEQKVSGRRLGCIGEGRRRTDKRNVYYKEKKLPGEGFYITIGLLSHKADSDGRRAYGNLVL